MKGMTSDPSGQAPWPARRERMFARRMGATTMEVAASHLAMVSRLKDVVELMEAAAGGDASLSSRAGCCSRRPSSDYADYAKDG
jgi:hypothetical protein